MQTILFIVNAPAYGSERMLSALRLASALAGHENEEVDLRLFMISDAVTVALPNQVSAEQSGGMQQMIEYLLQRGAEIRLCRSCVQTRGLATLDLIPGVTTGTMPELAEWTLAADKVLCF